MTSTISATARLQLNFTAGRCQATRIQHVQLNFKDGKFGVIRQRPFYLSKSHTVKSSPSHKASLSHTVKSPAPPRKRDREDDEIDTIETLSLGLAHRDRENDEIDTIELLSAGLGGGFHAAQEHVHEKEKQEEVVEVAPRAKRRRTPSMKAQSNLSIRILESEAAQQRLDAPVTAKAAAMSPTGVEDFLRAAAMVA